MFHLREHDLLKKTTKTFLVTSNEQEAHKMAKDRMKELNIQNICNSLVSIDDDINQKYNYDEMLSVIFKQDIKEQVIDLGKDFIETGNSSYPTIEIVR